MPWVIVVSIVDHFPGKSDGSNLLPQDGLPDVIVGNGPDQAVECADDADDAAGR